MMIQNDKVNFIRYLVWQLSFSPSKPSENHNSWRIRSIDIHTIRYQVFSGRDNSFVQKEKQLTLLLVYFLVFWFEQETSFGS